MTVSALPAVSMAYHVIDFLGNVQFVGSWSIWSQLPTWLLSLASLALERGWMLSPAPLALGWWYWRRASSVQKVTSGMLRAQPEGPLVLFPDVGVKAEIVAIEAYGKFARLKVTNKGNRGRFWATAIVQSVNGTVIWPALCYDRAFDVPWHGMTALRYCDMVPSEEGVLNIAESVNIGTDEPILVHLLAISEEANGTELRTHALNVEAKASYHHPLTARLAVTVWREVGGAGAGVCSGEFEIEANVKGEIRAVERGDWEIVSAFYGSSGHYMNVADKLRSLVSGGKLSIRVETGNLAPGDPSPGVVKRLFVAHMRGGIVLIEDVEEHQTLELP